MSQPSTGRATRLIQVDGHILSPGPIDHPIKMGDKVRSYDFEGRKDCYIEGTMLGFCLLHGPGGPWHYCIQMEKQIFADEDITAKVLKEGIRHYYPPMNGTPMLFGGGPDKKSKFVEKIHVADGDIGPSIHQQQ